MATIKSYSDLQQSKKLAEILPLESADMYYSHEFVNSAGDYYKLNIASEGYFDDKESLGSDIPAWSLAALLDVLPLEIETHKQTDGCKIYYYVELYMKRMGKEEYLSTERHENLVDACVAMIEKLHELNLL